MLGCLGAFRWFRVDFALTTAGIVALRLGLPGILTMSEWWFWEVTCFTAGMIGTPKPIRVNYGSNEGLMWGSNVGI